MAVNDSENFDELLRRRLGIIQQQGVNATGAAKQQEAQNQTSQMAQEQESYNSTFRNTKPASGSFNSFLNAIMGQESGGNSRAVNKTSGALGTYQILPSNVPQWSQEALGHSVSTQQFLNSADIQNKVARYKLQEYYNRYGAAGAAVAWYAGPGTAKKYVASGGVGFGRPQGNYPSISKYVQDILRRMG